MNGQPPTPGGTSSTYAQTERVEIALPDAHVIQRRDEGPLAEAVVSQELLLSIYEQNRRETVSCDNDLGTLCSRRTLFSVRTVESRLTMFDDPVHGVAPIG